MTPEEDRELRYLRHWFQCAENALKVYVRWHNHCGLIPDREREQAYRQAVGVFARSDVEEWALNKPE